MNGTILRDGTGTGARMKVDGDGRAHTVAHTVIAPHQATDAGLMYFISTPALDLNAIDTEHALLMIENTDPERHFHINRFAAGWNGGNTNYNKPMLAKVIGGPIDPTANHEAATISNTSTASTKIAAMTAYQWDGVGNGMTFPNATLFSAWVNIGYTDLVVEGGFIITPGNKIGICVAAPEIGNVSAFIGGWYEANETDLIE